MSKIFLAAVLTASFVVLTLKSAPAIPRPGTSNSLQNNGAVARDVQSRRHAADQASTTAQNARFSPDVSQVVFEARRGTDKCSQIYVSNSDGTNVHRVSSGRGRAELGQFFPDGKHILYVVTPSCDSARSAASRPASRKNTWDISPPRDIFIAAVDGSDARQLTRNQGFNGEAAISPDGHRILFTSTRDGDADLYTMDADGTHVTRLTEELGYDGKAFFSPDGNRILYRGYHPDRRREVEAYRAMLKQGAVVPPREELWIMRADGSDKRQITDRAAADVAYFLPDSKKVIFAAYSANAASAGGEFDLFTFNLDGTGIWRSTHNFESADDKKFKREGQRIYEANLENRRGLSEPKTFGALKITAYAFAAFTLALVGLRFSLLLLGKIKYSLDWIELRLRRAGRTMGFDFERAVANPKVTTMVRGLNTEKKCAHAPQSRTANR